MNADVAPAAPLRRNFFARYWRGEYSLPVSYWLINWLTSIAGRVAIVMLTGVVNLQNNYHPLSIFLSVVGVWGLACSIQVWQLVGLWRSAQHYLEQNQNWRRIWAYLARFGVVAATLTMAISVTTVGVPQIVEVSKILFADDPDLPDYTITLSEDGREIHVSGGFKYGLTKDLRARIDFAPQARVIVFDSIGGRIGEAESVYDLLVEKKLSTAVNELCASACALAFMGGDNRWLGMGGRIGFHSPDFVGLKKKDLASLQADFERKIIRRIGVPSSFFAKAHAVDPSDMWYPPRDILLENHVLTARFSEAPSSLRAFEAATAKTLASMRKDLPRRVDDTTDLIGFDIQKNVFVYTFAINAKAATRRGLQDSASDIEANVRSSVCKQDSIARLIAGGVVYRYRYLYGRETTPLIQFDIARC